MSNQLKMPQLLFGSFQMADDEKIYNIVTEAAEHGIKGFDTSPSYRTEVSVSTAINRYIKEHAHVSREDFFLQTKIDAWQMIQKEGDIRPFVKATLKKINQPYLDLLLIHWPQPDYFTQTWKYMEAVYEDGLAKSIGVCNCKKRHLTQLECNGANICPMVIQNELHPFNAAADEVAFFQSLGIIVQAYSPLCRMLPMVVENPCLSALANQYGVSIAQLILAWHKARNTVPIVKTSKPQRVMENIDAMKIPLSQEDMEKITSLNENFKIFLESRCCPGY